MRRAWPGYQAGPVADAGGAWRRHGLIQCSAKRPTALNRSIACWWRAKPTMPKMQLHRCTAAGTGRRTDPAAKRPGQPGRGGSASCPRPAASMPPAPKARSARAIGAWCLPATAIPGWGTPATPTPPMWLDDLQAAGIPHEWSHRHSHAAVAQAGTQLRDQSTDRASPLPQRRLAGPPV